MDLLLPSSCTNVICVPIPPEVKLNVSLDCLVTFSGTVSSPSHRWHVPHQVHERDIKRIGKTRHYAIQDKPKNLHVVFPMVDTYFALGYKIIRMVHWLQTHASIQKVLYLDKDIVENETPLTIANKFSEIPLHTQSMVGDIMDCWTPANQMCCCANRFFAQQHNLTSAYDSPPPLLHGASGIGFNLPSLKTLVSRAADILPYSDHTLSAWANKSGIHFQQAAWSKRAHRWCKQAKMRVTPVNDTHWKCGHSNKTVTTLVN